ncbi:unnamed protein product [Choristocarpus tenellus]
MNGGERDNSSEADQAKQVENNKIVAQTNAISDEIASSQPLIGTKESLSVLLPEYQGNPKPGFTKGVEDLCRRYSSLRRVRGDGNCFYRCFLFSLLEGTLAGLKREGDGGDRAKVELERLKQGHIDFAGLLGGSN